MSLVADTLAAVAQAPRTEWAARLRAEFPDDPTMVEQALAWLCAGDDRIEPRDQPSLGAGGERYKLGAVLDHGATASVWHAFDRRLGRNVAIKLFRPSELGASRESERAALAQIMAEARAASEVQGDHVVRVLDVHEDDPAYLVMELVGEREAERGELVPGASAASCRPRDLEEAVAWVRDVALGVHDAHLRNVFHRDLKPHNVLVTPFSRRAKIADFGLTTVPPTRTHGTRRARIAGTPGFMAPEQARGLPANLDPDDPDDRATLVGVDIWGIGAVAFELVTGKPPWQPSGDLDAWEVAVTSDAVPPVSRTSQGGRIPRRLARVIERALAPDRHARYATAAELASELNAYLARRPTSLDRSRWLRAALWCRRNPQLALTGLLALVLAASTVGANAKIRDIREQRNELAADIARSRDEYAVLSTRKQEILDQLAAAESNLAAKAASLEDTRFALAETKREYETLVSAKAEALRDAGAVARQLSEQLATTRRERDMTRVSQKMYEDFWARGRQEVAASSRERDEAEHDRDTARDQRDQAMRERDAALAAHAQVEQERDTARLDRDRAETLRRRLEIEVARLATELAAMVRISTSRDAGTTDADPP